MVHSDSTGPRRVRCSTTTVVVATILEVVVLGLTGCERVFTYSPFESLRRDPANLSVEQQVTFARDALSSGDPAAMEDAFALLSTSEDPETQLLAVDLALGAAEVETVLTDLLASGIAESEDPTAALEEALAGFSEDDIALLSAAADLLVEASAETEPTPEQYAFTAIGLVAVAASQAGGLSELESVDPDSEAGQTLTQAATFMQEAATALEESGQSADILSGFEDFL